MLPPRYCWLRRFVFCSVIVLSASLTLFCFYAENSDFPSPDRARSGDVIFICGKSIRSVVVSLLEGNLRSYSHVGLVVLENGRPFIIHADPAQGASTDKIMKEPWDVVLSTKRITAATIFRVTELPSMNSPSLQASVVAQKLWKDALPFDHEFDLATPQKLYCTELVWRAYMAVGIDLRGSTFGPERKYLLPSDLIKSGFLHKLL